MEKQLPQDTGFFLFKELRFGAGEGKERAIVFGMKRYKGKEFFAIQEFYDGGNNTLSPGKHSRAIPLDSMPDFVQFANKDIRQFLEKKGYNIGGRKNEKKRTTAKKESKGKVSETKKKGTAKG